MRILKTTMLVLLALVLITLVGSAVFAETRENVYLYNESGSPANGVEVSLEGNIQVQCVHFTRFTQFSATYDPVLDITILRWFGGVVNNGEVGGGCIQTNTNIIWHNRQPQWTWDGAPFAVAGPSFSHRFDITTPGVADLTIANTPVDGGPITIGIIQVGPSNTLFTLPELTWDNLNTMNWSFTVTNIQLKPGESMVFPIPLPSNAVGLVYRVKIWKGVSSEHPAEYVGEFVPQPTTH